MRERFITKRFGSAALEMVEKMNAILDDYQNQGYDLSLRQLFYQLVTRNLVENTEKSYKNVGSLVSDGRLAGLIDWEMIKDRGREMISNPHWDDPSDFLTSVAPQYRFDLWHDQETYVEVMVEKQALEGVLQPVCRRLDIPFTANKGYSSSSAMYEASKRFIKQAEAGKELFIIYLGDHDPSGIDMTRDVLDRLDLFVKTSMGREDEIGAHKTPAIDVKRVALNMKQVRELNPPENPAKTTDSRSADYIARYGESSWELDAIEPRQLASIVTDAVTNIMDVDKFNANTRRMERERAQLLAAAKKFKKKDED